MKTVAVIQARLRSTRLPGKILLPLPTGRTVLEEVIYRCREARSIHQVVVAMPDSEDSEILTPFTGGASIVYGPEGDVLMRYHMAARSVGADIIVRVTSDCPAIPSEMIDAVVAQRNVHGLAYACNVLPDTWPLGYACEAFTMRALDWHVHNTWDSESREHVTTKMRAAATGARHVNVPCPYGDYSHLRWTLDTIDDYARIVKVFQGAKGAANLLEVARA
jgi:spore coat polysaccharide biosynthesis protein SpsF (cytidylyltransferase family)